MSGYPLLHPGLTPAQHWLDQGAYLDSDGGVSTPPPWSDSCPALVRPEACLDSDVWVSTPPSWSDPCPALVGPGACLCSDEWVSTPSSWSDPCPGLVGPGGIFGLRRVGVHSSILV